MSHLQECDSKRNIHSHNKDNGDTILYLTIQKNSWNHFTGIKTEKGVLHTQHIASVDIHFKHTEKFKGNNRGQ